jgi:hypothetical protein
VSRIAAGHRRNRRLRGSDLGARVSSSRGIASPPRVVERGGSGEESRRGWGKGSDEATGPRGDEPKSGKCLSWAWAFFGLSYRPSCGSVGGPFSLHSSLNERVDLLLASSSESSTPLFKKEKRVVNSSFYFLHPFPQKRCQHTAAVLPTS